MGRPKGSLNADTQYIIDLCKHFDFSPAEMLVHISMGNYKALGYETNYTQAVTKSGDLIDVERLTIDHRQKACEKLMEYVYAKRRSVELKSDDDKGLNIVLNYSADKKE